ncbi:MAG TPA: hypothetical protein VKF59_11305 [Candidatus Dormibacteraeota bacterium]|nr:hypothetical protein [Candidatus Dormibacteraeota bacterium]
MATDSQATRVEGNRRLTGITAMVLLVLLAAEGLTVLGLRRHLPLHLFIGALLVPPALLKIGSVGLRFVRYYAGDPAFRAAGPPDLLMRLNGPLVVLSTLAVLATGLELWLFGLRFGAVWITAHMVSFLVWMAVSAVHVLAHLERAQRLAASELLSDDVPGGVTRRSLLGASLLLGLVLALVTVAWPGPFLTFPS